MRQITDAEWNNITENDGIKKGAPAGGYIVRIDRVEDVEAKEYLRIEWEFTDPVYRGDNAATYDKLGFWPMNIIRSYKESSLGFLKAFKTALEDSNRGYRFRTDDIHGMEGKLIGVVLGEEEFLTKKGEVKTRLYVAQTRSIQAIQKGDYKIPELKKLKPSGVSVPSSYGSYPATAATSPAPSANSFAELNPDEDGDLPF